MQVFPKFLQAGVSHVSSSAFVSSYVLLKKQKAVLPAFKINHVLASGMPRGFLSAHACGIWRDEINIKQKLKPRRGQWVSISPPQSGWTAGFKGFEDDEGPNRTLVKMKARPHLLESLMKTSDTELDMCNEFKSL